MTLTGLLSISQSRLDLPGLPCAGLPVAGMTLLGCQVRQLRRAGVTRILVLADAALLEQATTLTQALADLVARGDIAVLGSAADLVSLLDDADDVLMLDDATLLAPEATSALAELSAHAALLVWPMADPRAQSCVQLGPDIAYAGALRCRGATVRQIARGLGDWDLAQTLVRAVVAAPGAARLDLAAAQTPIWALLRRETDIAPAQSQLHAAAQRRHEDPLLRYVHRPLENGAVAQFVRWRWRANPVAAGAAAFGLAAIPAFALGWPGLGLGLGLALAFLCALADQVAVKLAQVQLDPLNGAHNRLLASQLIELGWVAALAWSLAAGHDGLGTAVLVASYAAWVVAIWRQRQLGDFKPAGALQTTLCRLSDLRHGFFWLLLPFGVASLWVPAAWFAGLVALVVLQAGLFFALQRVAMRGQPAAR